MAYLDQRKFQPWIKSLLFSVAGKRTHFFCEVLHWLSHGYDYDKGNYRHHSCKMLPISDICLLLLLWLVWFFPIATVANFESVRNHEKGCTISYNSKLQNT